MYDLTRIQRLLPATWPAPEVGPVRQVLGDLDAVGGARPLPSSAACLTSGEAQVWVPAPEVPPEPGLAPLYRHGDRLLVLPHVRLFVGDPAETDPEYLTADHWLEDALTRWLFPCDGADPGTVRTRLADLPVEQGLSLLGVVIRYALLGSDRPFRRAGLTFPQLPMWLRPVGDTPMAQAVARQLVLTARLKLGDPAAAHALPTTDIRAASARVTPAASRDFGLDPVHTPEGNDIRLLARLGVGTTVDHTRRLVPPPGTDVPLSLSTGRVPFAGYDDPRRLLMAANMQTQALPVVTPEFPRVRVDAEGIDPPGTNLHVGYLAYQGLNHEDAWVLSESAARKLAALRETVRTLAIRTVELPPRLRVAVGDRVTVGQRLLDRFAAPSLLTDDLHVLATLPVLDSATLLDAEPGDEADADAEVIGIVVWNLLDGTGVPNDVVIPDDTRAATRMLYRITLREVLPLEVGDKLANRHGHKGIVGAILPDAAMPRVGEQVLEALIDPISVVNRSNWGQLQECRAGGGGRDDGIFHGPQFILRLPQLAHEKLTVAPVRGRRTGVRYRQQRLGEMEHWALWAHGWRGDADAPLSDEAERLGRLLAVAGIALRRDGSELVVEPLDLTETPAASFHLTTETEATTRRLGVLSVRALFDQLDELEEPGILVLPEALAEVPTPLGSRTVGWLTVVPFADRPSRRLHDGSEQPHDLTVAYRRVLRAVRPLVAARRKADTSDEDEPEEIAVDLGELRQALARLFHEAYTLAVGRRATGMDSNKFAHLRRNVLGRRLTGSARAVVSPSGPLGLALDEIGLPEILYTALGEPESLWLKRDPVLHRYGLLQVRVRPVPGCAIRLPASLIGPFNADFDGDTVAVFVDLPGTPTEPHRNALHDQTGQALFVPGKQYVYGLSLLEESPARADFDAELRAAGAPPWPSGEKTTAARLRRWVSEAGANGAAQAEWWALVESAALRALEAEPGMELDLLRVEELPKLRAVRCGAAKNLYDDEVGLSLAEEFLTGHSLDRYRLGATEFDPVADVMVAAKSAIGRFGGALRRLLYALPHATPTEVRLAQTLTEQTTQKALSVKAGQPPVSVHAFEMQLRRLLKGEPWDLAPGEDLARILEPLRSVWGALQERFAGREEGAAPWLDWLRAPHELAELLVRFGVLRLPLEDLRLQSWREANSPRMRSPAGVTR